MNRGRVYITIIQAVGGGRPSPSFCFTLEFTLIQKWKAASLTDSLIRCTGTLIIEICAKRGGCQRIVSLLS
jgi:hypothetical protein